MATIDATPRVHGYRAIERIGQGGMGVVWRAVQLGTSREVALKILSIDIDSSGTDRPQRRFEREVKLAAALEHPNIARVYDAGLDEGVFFYAMEIVRGLPLDEFVRVHNLDSRQIIGLMRRVCKPVEFAHARGVVHRDLKPSNILVTDDAQPRILDFGLAKPLDPGQTLTLYGEIAGTPCYMSPEQSAGVPQFIGTRSDIYSLGVLLFRLLTGDFPYDSSGGSTELFRRMASEGPRDPRTLQPSMDVELQSIILRCLARAPEDRYPSVRVLREDLGRYLRGEPTSNQPADPFGLRNDEHGFLAWARRDPLLPVVLVLIGCVAFCATCFQIDKTSGLVLLTARIGFALLASYFILFPMAVAAVRWTIHLSGDFLPKDLRPRAIAAFLPTLITAGILWIAGAEGASSIWLALGSATIISAAALLLLFNPRANMLPAWLVCASVPTLIGIPAIILVLWAANAVTSAILSSLCAEGLLQASPFGPRLQWFDTEHQ